jgi:uncharacterized protein YqeY
MGIKTRISEDIKTAMKQQNKDRLQVLRMVLSELKYAQANSNVHEDLPEAEEIKVVSTYQKRLEKSLNDFPDGEAKSKILAEIKVVAEYLPTKANESEIQAYIHQLLQSDNERQFGLLMKKVMTHFGAAADGKLVGDILKKSLV